MTLKQILDGYHMDVLRIMLRHNAMGKAASKKQAVSKILRGIDKKARIAKAMKGLDSAELTAIARMLQANGQIRSRRLEQILLTDGVIKLPITESRAGQPVRLEGNYTATGTPSFADLLAKLAVKGLVFSHGPTIENATTIKWIPGRTVTLPPTISRAIDKTLLPKLPDLRSIDPAFVRSGSVVNNQRDINNYVRTIRREGGVKLTTTRLVYKTALKKIAETITWPSDLGRGKSEGENGYLFFLRRLLMRQKMLVQTYENLSASDATHPFWGLDSAERIKSTYVTWRDTDVWNGPRILPSYTRGVELTAAAHDELIPARKIVLDHIAKLGTGWVSFISLINRIETQDYGFLFPERDQEPNSYGYYYYHQTKYQRSPYSQANNPQYMVFDETIKDEADGWDRVEAAYIAHIIAGPLYWLGLVDLGYTGPAPANDLMGLAPFAGYRLTPHGEWLLGLGDKPQAEAEQGGGIILQPNFEILAMSPIPVETLMTLDAFAQVKDSQQTVTTYELTRESVYRGQQGRWQVEDIKAFFAQHSKMPVPDNVRRTLDEWDALFNRVTIRRRVSLAEVASDDIAAKLAELEGLERVDASVLVAHKPQAQVAQAVRAAGYLPLQTREGDRTASKNVDINDDGLVTYAHPVPSIFAKQVLADISVELNDTQRQILPSMVKAATHKGAYFAEFFGRIKRLSRTEVSPKLANNLKAWANYYGDAQQARVILTEFKDHDTLRELIADPELSAYITPLAKSNRPLAIIDPDNLDLVNELLNARGVNISQGIS